MKNFNSKKQAQGFTLIELMLSLAAIVALTAIVFIAFPKVMASRNATYEAQVLSTAAASVKSLFTSGNYSKLGTEVAAKGGFFPDSMISTDKKSIANQFDNGAVTVGFANSSGATSLTEGTSATAVDPKNRFFGITYAQVPAAVCVKLAGAAAPNFDKVIINGVVVKNTLPRVNPQIQLDEALVTTNCNQTAGATMIFMSN